MSIRTYSHPEEQILDFFDFFDSTFMTDSLEMNILEKIEYQSRRAPPDIYKPTGKFPACYHTFESARIFPEVIAYMDRQNKKETDYPYKYQCTCGKLHTS